MPSGHAKRTGQGHTGMSRARDVATERDEWRALAWSLAVLLATFGAGWLYAAHVADVALGWPVAIAYGIALAWLARALVGWGRGRSSAMDAHALAIFRETHFWSRPARWSYAALLVCDALFLLDINPGAPVLFFVLIALSGVFAIEIAVLSTVLGALQLF